MLLKCFENKVQAHDPDSSFLFSLLTKVLLDNEPHLLMQRVCYNLVGSEWLAESTLIKVIQSII